MSTVMEQIKLYQEDFLNLEISPFEHLQTLHLRSELQKQFSDMSMEEQIELMHADLQIIQNAKEISDHLSMNQEAKEFKRPISEWWWHLDKVASGELVVSNFSIEVLKDKN